MAYNCQNCGASINSLFCQYCGTRNDIDNLRSDKITYSHDSHKRVCSNCSIPLITHKIVRDINNIYIDKCEKCFGIFFDFGELETILNDKISKVEIRSIKIEREVLDNPLMEREKKALYKKCPVCQKRMNRLNYRQKSGVIIDKCIDHGFWLDAGELEQITTWAKAKGIEEFKPELSIKPIEMKNSNYKKPLYGYSIKHDRGFGLIDSFFRYLYGF